jgi:molybdopterin molybdotransferase
MKSVDQHLEDCLAGIETLSPLELRLLDAHGCTLSEDVQAQWNLPPFTNSSMDGYAVRAEDVAGASESSPVSLPVVGDIPAGYAGALAVAPGQSARIMTGAPMPAGADAVVPVEWTDGDIVQVSITRPAQPKAFVRFEGEDASAGDHVLPAGTHLGPQQLALLAAVGRARVLVRPRPRVVVMSTGSELVEPGEPIAGGKIPDSNSFMLAAAAQAAGATAYRVGFVPDEPKALITTIEDQLIRADLVITTGGVSVGAYDVVKEALGRMGKVSFDRVAMQPGMPRRDPDLHAAREPGLRLRVVRDVRASGPAAAAGTRAVAPAHRACSHKELSAVASRQTPVPEGTSRRRGRPVRRRHGRWSGFASACGPGQRQLLHRGARGPDPRGGR